MTLQRRDFLALASLASARFVLAKTAAGPHPQFPQSPRERIAVATYPFRAHLVAPRNGERKSDVWGMDLGHFAQYIRKEFDVPGIEPLHSHFPSMELDEVRRLKAAFDSAAVHTVNIPVDEEVDLCSPEAKVREQGYEVYRRWIDIAVILRSPSIRISLPGCGGQADIAGPVKALEPVVSYAASQNIIVNFENDDPVLGSAERITAVLKAASSPYMAALPDFANSLMGGDESFNRDAVKRMFAYAINIAHVKDSEIIKDVRRKVSLEELFMVAKAAQYRGYFSMESESGLDPEVDTKTLISRSVALM